MWTAIFVVGLLWAALEIPEVSGLALLCILYFVAGLLL